MCPPFQSTIQRPATHEPPKPSSIPSIIPSDALSQAAYTHAAQNLHPTILNHSLRVFLHAKHIAQLDEQNPLPPDPVNISSSEEKGNEPLKWHINPSLQSLLLTASLFHDIGTSAHYNTSPTARFEIEGADASFHFLSQFPEVSAKQRREVWEAIALHSTPQIPERMGGLVRLLRLGVAIDFGRPGDERARGVVEDKGWIHEVECAFPRGDIEKVLGDAVVEQALERPAKAPPACWPGGLYRAKLAEPEWKGVNKAF